MVMTSIAGDNTKKRTSQGRRKIEIKKIEQVNSRQVTFSKRRTGLFKKASELCILTGAQICILVNSPGGRVFAFGHPTADILIDRHLNATTPNPAPTEKHPPVKEFNQRYVEVSNQLEAEKLRSEVILQESKQVKGSGLPWYEEAVDGLEMEELQQYLSSLQELKRKVEVRADELAMMKKTPALMGTPNMMDMGGAGYVNDMKNIEIPMLAYEDLN